MKRVALVATVQFAVLYYFTWMQAAAFQYLIENMSDLAFNLALGFVILLGVGMNYKRGIDAVIAIIAPLTAVGLMSGIVMATQSWFFLEPIDVFSTRAQFYTVLVGLWVGVPCVFKWAFSRLGLA